MFVGVVDQLKVTDEVGGTLRVWEVLEEVDGEADGEGACEVVRVGDACGTVWPGKHTTSTGAGQMPPVQFHAPYSVLSAHEPSPVQEMLQRLGLDDRVQNMLMLVHETLAEQWTEAPSCTTIASSPGVTEQLCGSPHISDVLLCGSVVGQPLHMHRRGLEGMGPSCMEQLIADGEGGGQELAKGELATFKVAKLERLSNSPDGR